MAKQTEPLTCGGASWKEAPEIGLEQVQSDGLLVINDLVLLKKLVAPWNLATETDEILIEVKMQGDHVDLPAVSRTLLRRQARETQRIEQIQKGKPSWTGRQTIWLVSAYIPGWAKERYGPDQLEPGCYRWAKEHFTALWIAANELPLRDELVPFLITRTGRPLRQFVLWAKETKAWPIIVDLINSLPMLSEQVRDNVKYEFIPQDDEERENIEAWADFFAEHFPHIVDKHTKRLIERTVETTALRDGREALLVVLQARKLEVRPEQLEQINACTNVDTLHRWLAQAATATSPDDALSD